MQRITRATNAPVLPKPLTLNLPTHHHAESNFLSVNVASVYSKPFTHGGSSGGHYGGNPETYMDVGQAMGKAMVELLSK